jgi:hypothetical protein
MIVQKLLKTKPFFIALIGIILIGGCQKEYDTISEQDTDVTISPNDPITDLLVKIALKDGSFDNILDGCNEISIKFPYSVRIKNEVIGISSFDDVQNLKLEYFEQRNEFTIIFPVTIVFSDYSETTLSNKGELLKIQNQYNATIEDDDIENIDFIYPLKMALYNTEYQKYDLVDINDDKELYNVFSKMNNMIVEMQYPILVESSDESTTTINNNSELEDVISQSANIEFNEKDDIVFSDEDYPYDELITHKKWKIFLFTDTVNQSNLFSSYILGFKKNNRIQVNTDTKTYNGSWELVSNQNIKTLKIEFNSDEIPISWLNKSWVITNTSPILIEMEAESASGGYVSMFILKTLN